MLKTPKAIAIAATFLVLGAGCSPSTQSEVQPVKNPDNTLNANAAATSLSKFVTVAPQNPEKDSQQQIQQYLKRLNGKGFGSKNQGVWMQAGNTLLANHQGTVAIPAASLTKVATSLAALTTFGADHQFITQIGTTGTIKDGVVQGDLVVQGGEDPLFVWEEAIALGNLLNQKGIKRVTGNLIIVDKFYMNYEQNPLKSGNLLKQGINSRLWPGAAQAQYQTLPPGTLRPQVAIDGVVKVAASPPIQVQPLMRHYSFPMAELVKKMNQYSNNKMADMLASSVGGAKIVAQKAAKAAGVPESEIQLINGSGLGEENRISPRAVIAMFLAIGRDLESKNMTVADVFTVVGEDEGILEQRQLPRLAVIKSGSLNRVSALAGALPTSKQGTVWFAVMNSGGDLNQYRQEQEIFLNSLVQEWGAVASEPAELSRLQERKNNTSRTEILN
jgi:serine-type D-Ala-D-Ala carboxypeptidase/endopeptidase (penicillin-binding protein 4)